MEIDVWVQGRYVGATKFSGPRHLWDDTKSIAGIFRSLDQHVGVKQKEIILSPVTTPKRYDV